jgi:ribonucleoside-diphosphate reductase alpha chain
LKVNFFLRLILELLDKGARLVTAGGKAPGPEPLKICLVHIQAILDRKAVENNQAH